MHPRSSRTLGILIFLVFTQSAIYASSLGDVHFPTSCKASVQSTFDSGVALLHSFEFREAETNFREVEREDPKCVIAAWGVALSTTERAGASAPQRDLSRGWVEFEPWLPIKAGTEREQMYVDAVTAMYQNYATVPGEKRWKDYLTIMRQLCARYPDDINASLFYGLGLTWTAGPGKPGLEKRREALAIFFPIFQRYPNNPGAAHYIIHAADTAELAPEALPAARKYASIAPDSPHALHMPSHIFNRLGLWQDSIRTNEASARVAAQWVSAGRDGLFDEFHALNNIEYAALQLGDDEKAKRTILKIADLTQVQKQGDAWLPIDARIYYDLEMHNWADASQIEPPSSSPFEENFDAYWIEAIGAARSGEAVKARIALNKYRDSETAWSKRAGWGDILAVGLAEAEAWTLFAEGHQDQAVARLRSMEAFERDHPMYYADILPRPIGEMLGDMLLQRDRPKEALAAYEAALKIAPNRLDSLLGAYKAAKSDGQQALAAGYRAHISNADEELAKRP